VSRIDALVTDAAYRPEPREIAAGLAERGLTVRLDLSAYFTPDSPLVRVAPSGIAQYLLRREAPGLDRRAVRRRIYPDAIRLAIRKLGGSGEISNLVVNVLFDRVTSLFVPRGIRVCVGHEGGSLATLRRARRLGARIVVIANTPDPVGEAEIVAAEERRLGLPRRRITDATVTILARRTRKEFAQADLVIGNSEFTRRDLIEHGLSPAKVAAVPLGVDLASFSPGPRRARAGEARIVYVGSLQARKGVIHLVHAVERLRAEGVPCALHAYGTGHASYTRLLESDAVSLHGFVAHHGLPEVYRSADVFVLPTLSDGFGLVVYEAMACGVPVIVTDRCGAAVEDGVTGRVVQSGDPAPLAEAIRELLADPARAEALAAAGAERAARSSWAAYRADAASFVLDGLRPEPAAAALAEGSSV
jgi:glycosyltransferase involved in cell wall biosynthesis